MGNKEFEVIIIGGSYAGLSAALSLGRSLRKTLVIDAGKPCNRQTPHSHNFLTQDGSTPQELLERAKKQVSRYDRVKFYDGHAISGKRTSTGFEITTSKQAVFSAKKLVFATGIKDLIPNIKGFSECWGISVVHCPYCHGYEIRKKKTAILANGEKAFHLAPLVRNLTDDITVITAGKPDFSEGQMSRLHRNRIRILEKEIAEIKHVDGQLKTLVFKDGSQEGYDAAYAPIPFEQNTGIPQELGCNITEGGYIEVDPMYKTTQEGIFACGDGSSMFRSVATAVYGGNVTGALLNKELTEESF
ncbi:NAD(P)/FAD-dependent oxidoreductase [Pseudozobellia thermophila]|uniref:Thioredoxin reductase n=1 Tax=Pseudozobellia thermophila TaxID=192903 RepID=A0A1M6NRV1_9FLAO|nr:NAD(P)/FAD-dependent oxidoreductase [Pseudozobellia thermophila]SHJ98457.1 Thioredoxin reductase [Pseudozobellia thermophila]